MLTGAVALAALALPLVVASAAVGQPIDMQYQGGAVLQHSSTHLIFWQPAGSGLSFDPGYVALVERFIEDVADASHSTANELGIMGQYGEPAGPAAYAITDGGAVLDTDPLPPSGCVEPVTTGPPGWLVCLTDAQLQAEIARIISGDHLPSGPTDVYFLLTPRGFGACMDAASSRCALGGPTGYCGYHSATHGDLVYAVIPYNAVPGHCRSADPRPNSSTADPALSTISHELAEAITDPFGDAWSDSNGDEIGDVCASSFGPVLGGTGDGRWDERIDQDHYWLQELWSRLTGECEPRPRPDRVSVALAVPPAGGAVLLAGRAFVPGGRAVSWLWRFGDGRSGHGRRVRHVFARRGRYTVRLRVTDSSGNWTFARRLVRVT